MDKVLHKIARDHSFDTSPNEFDRIQIWWICWQVN